MAEFTTYEPGTPSWIDLATTDLEGAKRFYCSLFGWTSQDIPTPTGAYTMFHKEGTPVAGANEMTEEQRSRGVPPMWLTYVSVVDADEVAGRVEAAGGQLIQAASDVMGAGRMALLQDPTGATVALWQPGAHIGAGLANEPGTLSWNELQTTDTKAAAAFYEQLFGWRADTATMPTGIEYTSFVVGEHPVAGMMEIQTEWGEVPPNWGVYLGVAGCDESAKQVTELGGTIEMPPGDIPDVGRFALVRDPQGAYFYIFEFAATG